MTIKAIKDELHSTLAEISRLQPVVEQIAGQIDPHDEPDRFKITSDLYAVERSAERLIGIIDNQETLERIFTSRGPQLDARNLHPWVWYSVVDLWDDGHYKQAVVRASSVIEQQTQLKLDREDLSGDALYTEAFSSSAGRRLRFKNINKETIDGKKTQSWKSAHQGAMYLGKGCTQGIRNLQVHGTDPLEEQQALEYLAVLSILARWIESAEVQASSHA